MDHLPTETPMQRGAKMLRDSGYRADGGEVTMARVKKTVKRALISHENAEHGGEHKPIRLKAGGPVKGHKPEHRPDKRGRDAGGAMPGDTPQMSPQMAQAMMQARAAQAAPMQQQPGMGVAKNGGKIKRASGGGIDGDLNGVATVDRRYKAEGIDQPHGPARRAEGGGLDMPSTEHPKPKTKSHGAPKNVIVMVGHGDDGAKAQMAHQEGMQQGAQLGARAAMQKMAAAGGGGPPRPPMAPPPGPAMPPPGGGGMAGGPPMMGAPRPPMGAPPPQMARAGGMIRDRMGRFVGGAV